MEQCKNEYSHREHVLESMQKGKKVIQETHNLLALEGVSIALKKHIERLKVLEPRFTNLHVRYGKLQNRAKKRPPSKESFSTARRVILLHRKLEKCMGEERKNVQYFRGLLIEQIRASEQFGHSEISQQYTSVCLSLGTPMETGDLTSESIDLLNENCQRMLQIWKQCREHILTLIAQGNSAMSAMQKTIVDVNRNDGSLQLALE